MNHLNKVTMSVTTATVGDKVITLNIFKQLPTGFSIFELKGNTLVLRKNIFKFGGYVRNVHKQNWALYEYKDTTYKYPLSDLEFERMIRQADSVEQVYIGGQLRGLFLEIEEMHNLEGSDNPVLCVDGKIGMLTVYPDSSGLCGIQVNGQEEHRWINVKDLRSSIGGAIWHVNSPALPPVPTDTVQVMMLMDWWSRR